MILKTFLKNSSITLIATVILGILNWIYNRLVFTRLSDIEIKEFTIFSAILIISTIPLTFITNIGSKYGTNGILAIFAKFKSSNKFSKLLFSIVAFISPIFIILYSINVGLSIKYVLLLILVFVALSVQKYYNAGLSYNLKFIYISIILLIESITKVIFFLVFYKATGDFNIGILGFCLQLFLSTILHKIVFERFNKNIKHNKEIYLQEKVYHEVIYAIFYGLSFLCFTNIDLLYIGSYFKEVDIAEYQRILQPAKILLFVLFSIVQLLLPTLSNIVKNKQSIRKIILLCTSFVLAGTFGFLGIVNIFSGKIIELFQFNIGMYNLNLIIITQGIYILSQIVLVTLYVKGSKFLIRIVLVTILLQAGLYLIFAKDIYLFINITLISAIIYLISYTFIYLKEFHIQKSLKYIK